MRYHFSQFEKLNLHHLFPAKGRIMSFSLSLLLCSLVPISACAQDDDTEGINGSQAIIPGSVKELAGLEVTRASLPDYTTVGRPDNYAKEFVLYNVGTGMFLNVGGYWGSHAALDVVPRPFWLQYRSESPLSYLPSYLRYPESISANPNSFAYQFFALNKFQMGSCEGKNRSHAVYNHVKVISGGKVIYQKDGYAPNGDAFEGEITDFSFSDGSIEAEIDLTNCVASKDKMENILSVGPDISQWVASETCLHIYAYEENSRKRVRVDDMGPDRTEPTHRFGGSVHPIVVGDDNLVRIRIVNGVIDVNGVNCVPGSEQVVRSIQPLTALSSFKVGKGDNSKAVYSDVSTVSFQIPEEKKNITAQVPMQTPKGAKFGYAYAGHLVSLAATINLDGCTGTSENILSIGTCIERWGTGKNDNDHNLHLYYTKRNKTLQLNAVDKDRGNNAYQLNLGSVSGTIQVTLDATNGLQINGNPVSGKDYTAANPIIAYLLAEAEEVQVGSREGVNRSNATYSDFSLTYFGAELEQVEKSLLEGQILTSDAFSVKFSSDEYIKAEMDLSQCATQGENILNLDAATSEAGNQHSLHFYYLGKVDGNRVVRAVYDEGSTVTDGYSRAISVPEGSKLSLVISEDGLIANGRNIYPEDNLMPAMAFDPDKAGKEMKFKVDAYGNFLLNENNKLILDEDNGRHFKEANQSYMYSMDDLDGENEVGLFLSSRFRKRTSASSKEGSFLAWTPYANDTRFYGDVGVFTDRSLTVTPAASATEEEIIAMNQSLLDNSRWFFEKVDDGSGQNVYKLYLKMNGQKVLGLKDQKQVETIQSGKFYLQAGAGLVYGNGYEDYGREDAAEALAVVDALTTEPQNAALGYWKLIPVDQYNDLFKGVESDFASMFDQSFLMSDPNFTREDAGLTDWKMDESLLGDTHTYVGKDLITGASITYTYHDVNIGYDYYGLKSLTDNDYTDEHGVRNTTGSDSEGKSADKTRGSDAYQVIKGHERNHARYMGVEVCGLASGRFYQEVTVGNFGWYAVTCKGLSSMGAELFVQKATDAEGNWVSKKLHVLQDSEMEWLRSASDKAWPYDCVNDTVGMPMYNALVAMNDEHTVTGPIVVNGERISGKQLTDSLQTQIVFYVGKNDLDKDGKLTLRVGINIPEKKLPDDFEIYSQDDGDFTISLPIEWTVFDDFHLLFGGNAPDPHLVLDEDSTSLDYLDKTIHHFVDRPMHLKRTFTPNVWSTIILPVNLSAADFRNLFGETARLAILDHLTDRTVEFVSVEEQAGVFLKAYTPYIIRVDKAHATGEGLAYSGSLYVRTDGSMPDENTPKIAVKADAGNFYLKNATLEDNYTDPATGQGRYNFAQDTKAVTDSLYTYQGVTAVGGGHAPLVAYGTLCKNYDAAKHTILEGRPGLVNAYVMSKNTMKQMGSQYGTKGFRCWFMPTPTGGEASVESGSLNVAIDGIVDETTTIRSLNASNAAFAAGCAEGVYSLNGQKVRSDASLENLPAGVYVVNGEKFVVQ